MATRMEVFLFPLVWDVRRFSFKINLSTTQVRSTLQVLARLTISVGVVRWYSMAGTAVQQEPLVWAQFMARVEHFASPPYFMLLGQGTGE